MLQTRIASIDEINYIKDQVKRRQQKRFFVRAAVFASIAFALFVIWCMMIYSANLNFFSSCADQ